MRVVHKIRCTFFGEYGSGFYGSVITCVMWLWRLPSGHRDACQRTIIPRPAHKLESAERQGNSAAVIKCDVAVPLVRVSTMELDEVSERCRR